MTRLSLAVVARHARHSPLSGGTIFSHLSRIAIAFLAMQLTFTAANAQDRPEPVPPKRVLGIPSTVPLLMLGNAPGQLPVVEVLLNGKGPFRFGIETGANFLTIRPALSDSLGLARAGGTDQYPEYVVETMSIGAARFEGVRVSALRTASRDIDGVLGLPLYSGLLLTIDYPGRTVRFEQGSLSEPNGRDILPLTRVADFWGVPVSFGDKVFQGVIDTRSTGAFGVTPGTSKSLTFEREPIVVGRAVGAAIAETEVKSGQLTGAASIGQYRFPTPEIGIRALPPGFPEEPLIGTVVLQQFVMTLDQAHKRVRLARNGDHTIELPRRASRAPGNASATTQTPNSNAGSSSSDAALLVGTYGDRAITIERDTLWLQRPGGQKLALISQGNDTFTIRESSAARFEFERDGAKRGVKLRVLNREGQWEVVGRVP